MESYEHIRIKEARICIAEPFYAGFANWRSRFPTAGKRGRRSQDPSREKAPILAGVTISSMRIMHLRIELQIDPSCLMRNVVGTAGQIRDPWVQAPKI